MSHFRFFVKVYAPREFEDRRPSRSDPSGNVPFDSYNRAGELVAHLARGGYRAEIWTTIHTASSSVNVPVEGLLEVATDLREEIEHPHLNVKAA